MGTAKVIHGDCVAVLPTLEPDSIDAVVTDPPYGLEFMGREWDHADGFRRSLNKADAGRANVFGRTSRKGPEYKTDSVYQQFIHAVAKELLRILKPGAFLVAFGATRGSHRMVCAIEDAGFEIRDSLAWLYGTGFPKSHNVGNGWGTALKPAFEPITLARKPLSEKTVAANVLRWRTGAINVDGCGIEASDGYAENCVTQGINTAQTSYTPAVARRTFAPAREGRWPANVVHDGSAEVIEAFPERDGAVSNSKSGVNTFYGKFAAQDRKPGFADKDSAARFFYSAKADADDRLGSKHPTVKPVDLIAWLCRLVTPSGGTVLDPFAGSGTTGAACAREGFNCILIEREKEYHEDILKRLDHISGADTPLFR